MNYINVLSSVNENDLCVDFGDYESLQTIDAKGTVHYKRAEILSVKVNNSEEYVKVRMTFDRSWYLQVKGYTGTDYPIVDKIDGVEQTTLEMLKNTIGALIT